MSREAALARLGSAEWLNDTQPFFVCLDGAQGRTRAVGGIVRDTLLGRARGTTDIDMATELLPEDVMARGKAAGLGVHPTGIAHGTITLVHQGQTVEVTTLRRDVETFGRQARVAFGTDWILDASRRDFTMNALYCGPEGELFDPLDGLDDCLAWHVRFIGDPDARIAEDRLRVYRYFRFAVSHGAQRFDPEQIAACARAADDLGALSAERVGSEMMRLLAHPRCATTLDVMVSAGVLSSTHFTPSVLATLHFLEALPVSANAEMRLAIVALLDGAVGIFRKAWRLSNATVKRIEDLSGAAILAKAEAWAELRYRYPDAGRDGIAVAAAIGHRSIDWYEQGLAELEKYPPARFPLSGADLTSLGIEPGPALGAELKRLERVWIDSGFALGREALLAEVRRA